MLTTGHLSLLANGGDVGNAGIVQLAAFGAASAIKLSPVGESGTFNIEAASKNGLGGGTGSGGQVFVTAGRQIELVPGAGSLQVKGSANAFSRPNVFLSAGSSLTEECCGNVFINGPLDYQDQQVNWIVQVRSSTPFVIGNPTQLNGIAGDVDLSGAQNDPAGGYYGGGNLSVSNRGTGGITLSPGAAIRSVGGNNGIIDLNARSGTLTYSNNVIDVNGGFATPLPNPAMLPGSPGSPGGTISLKGANIVAASGTIAPLQLSARGGTGGNGGSVIIESGHSFNSVTIGSGAGQISINATGGAKGGTVALTGANIAVSAAALAFNTNSATNGGGGSFTANASMNFLWTGALDVSGVGIGNGGIVSISQGFSPFSINQNSFNGITGELSSRFYRWQRRKFQPGFEGVPQRQRRQCLQCIGVHERPRWNRG